MLRTPSIVLATLLVVSDLPLAQEIEDPRNPLTTQARTGGRGNQEGHRDTNQHMVLYDVADLCTSKVAKEAPDTRPFMDLASPATSASSGLSLSDLKLLVESRLEVQVDLGQAAPETMRFELTTLGHNALVVLGTDAVHAEVRGFLDDLRSFHAQAFLVSCWLITMPTETATQLSFGSDPRFFANDAEFEALLSGVRENEDRELVSTPRFVTLNGRQTHVTTMQKLLYISGYTLHREVAPLGEDLHIPVVDYVAEGVDLFSRITSGGAEASITVELTGHFASVQRPIQRLTGPDGAYCHPIVTSRAITTTVILPGSGRVALPVVVMDGRATLTLLEVERVLPLPTGDGQPDDTPQEATDPTGERRGR